MFDIAEHRFTKHKTWRQARSSGRASFPDHVGMRATCSVHDLMNLKARWSPGYRSWAPSAAMIVTVRPLNREEGRLRLRPVPGWTRRLRH